ncbi:MAG TPA: CsgG/HfaB family protein [Polyangia bacterium]
MSLAPEAEDDMPRSVRPLRLVAPGRPLLAPLVALAAVGAGLLGPRPAAAADRPALSVLYFENRTGQADYDVLRKGLADMIVTDLAAWDGVTVLERERLEAVLAELKLQQTKFIDATRRQQIGKLLGAQYVLIGTLNLAAQTLAIDAQLVEVKTGAVRVAARARGAPDRVFELEQELVNKITAGIDARLKNPGQRRAAKVQDIQTLLAYSKAVDLADRGRLDEAHRAMMQVVSRNPMLLMARDARERILKQLDASGKRRTELVSGAVVALGRICDQGLKNERGFDALDEAGQRRFLALRLLRSRVLGRVLRQHLSSRSHLYLILRGQEKDALRVMRALAENHRRLIDELGRVSKKRTVSWFDMKLDNDTERLVRDAQLGRGSLSDEPVSTLVSFVLLGRVRDGDNTYTVGPALGDLDPKEQKAAFELLDREVTVAMGLHAKTPVAQQAQHEHRAARALEEKATALIRLDQDEAAVAAYQRILDAFPTGHRAQWIENRIKQIAGATHDHERSTRERWAKALTDCKDMDIRVGDATLHRKLVRLGLAALAVHAGELEKACKVGVKTRSAFAYVYGSLARTAAVHEDCASYRAWTRKYLEVGGSVGDMQAYAKRTPWCELGDVTKNVVWFKATYDDHWSLELDRHLTTVRSHDGKVLSLFGGREGGRAQLSIYLDATGPNQFRCRLAQWTGMGGDRREGSCSVTLKKLAREPGELDEGVFTASFPTPTPNGRTRTIEMKGDFRLRRH